MATIQVVIFEYPGVMASAVAGIKDLFTIANRFSELVDFTLAPDTPDGPPSPSSATVVIVPPCIIEPLPDYAAPEQLARLGSLTAQADCMAASCAGVFWLGAAGLLDGKTVTTHWALHDELRARYPGIGAVDRHNMVVDQGEVITAAGVYAFQDLVLYILARFGGYTLAKRVADFTMLDISGRLQSYYARFQPDYTHGDERVLQAQEHCNRQPLSSVSVKSMAEAAHLSERMLARRFKKALNLSPGQYLVELKIEHAKQALENSQRSIEAIAEELGYWDQSNFIRAFKRTAGVSPAIFRARRAG